MKGDYHIHTHLCGHARGSMKEYAEASIERGCSRIGFADHLPMLFRDDPSLSMSEDELPGYVDEVLGLRERYEKDLSVLLGIEADYHPSTIEKVAEMIDAYPFDYVIGSVHVLGDWLFDDPREIERYDDVDLNELYIDYFRTQESMVQTGLFDVVSHPDLVKKFNLRASIDLKPHYKDLLRKIKKAGMCYEINTAGLRWQVSEMYPEPDFVRLGAELGVPVTYGSDAHCPEDVGRDFDKALELMKTSGYLELAHFSQRILRLDPLPDSK
ncbi:MAG: histidinol-phosphatase HisJ family protein [Actinobacteria bacterium]|nr:histidinol-phosphatase HisJ family protein [Actinomycetota bacterium]